LTNSENESDGIARFDYNRGSDCMGQMGSVSLLNAEWVRFTCGPEVEKLNRFLCTFHNCANIGKIST